MPITSATDLALSRANLSGQPPSRHNQPLGMRPVKFIPDSVRSRRKRTGPFSLFAARYVHHVLHDNDVSGDSAGDHALRASPQRPPRTLGSRVAGLELRLRRLSRGVAATLADRRGCSPTPHGGRHSFLLPCAVDVGSALGQFRRFGRTRLQRSPPGPRIMS
jgi:hypothetical protein